MENDVPISTTIHQRKLYSLGSLDKRVGWKSMHGYRTSQPDPFFTRRAEEAIDRVIIQSFKLLPINYIYTCPYSVSEILSLIVYTNIDRYRVNILSG